MENIDFLIERQILKIGNKLNYIRKADLQQYNITTTQSETLLFYFSNEGKSINELKNHLKISHQAARKLVDKLKEKGFLTTMVSKEDARFCCVCLTNAGKHLCEKLRQQGELAGNSILQGLSESEKNEILNYLNYIEKHLD